MSESFPAVECSIETLDRTLYASREVGDLVDTGDYILSTALYHAFGFVSGKYINSGNKPSYIEETSEIYKKVLHNAGKARISRGICEQNSWRPGHEGQSKAFALPRRTLCEPVERPASSVRGKELESGRFAKRSKGKEFT